MRILKESHGHRWSERGQTLVLVPLLLIVLLSMCAFVIDLGNVYVCYQQLQNSTTAAALAAGAAIPQGTAVSVAKQYSGSTTQGAIYNVHPALTVSSVTPTLGCVQPTLYSGLSLPVCQTYGGQPSANVIQVKETASVPTYFARIFGVASVPISATATASASGGGAPPYNIMLVLDTTGSMGTGTDSGCVVGSSGGSYSPIQCAQLGIQTLLSELNPCATTYATCPTNGSTGLGPNAVDQVGIMVFPGITPTQTTTLTSSTTPGPTANRDYSCPPSNPSITTYNANPGYLVLPFQNDYRKSDIALLNFGSSGSNLVKSVGATTNGSCTGTKTPGGQGTFYAGAIVAAADYLNANQRPGAQNVMIVLSDGDATASTAEMAGSTPQSPAVVAAVNQSVGGNPTMNGNVFSANFECTQAVAAANYAKNISGPGIKIYSISYGSTNAGCLSEQYTNPVTKATVTTPYYNDPCATMRNIASLPLSQYFFSVPNQAVPGTTVCPGGVNVTQLSQVFTIIAGNLTTSRLVPNSVF